MAFTPHTKEDIQAMLAEIGAQSIEDLFDEIPKHLRTDGIDPKVVTEAITEWQAKREFAQRAARDKAGLCFIGAGAYEHHIPAAIWDITSRGEFYTAYTPYQAEASQGTLQLLYEYQTMMASLMGLEVSNASLYDGASAAAEAILMAIRSNKHSKSRRVLVPTTLHPHYRKVIKTILEQQKIEIVELPFCSEEGRIIPAALTQYQDQDVTALVIPQPNFFGILEDVDTLTDWAHQQNALVIGVVNPTAMALLKEPGSWGQKGADIACGEGQPLGVPLASGGPYFGFLTSKKEFVRQMPGRIVGRTVDLDGKPGFSLTLQAREQHIRRSKATSNICTNQGLLVTAATIYMSLVGPNGLKQIAGVCHSNARNLVQSLAQLDGVEQVFSHPYFHECVLRLSKPSDLVLKELARRGIQGGLALNNYYPELGNAILVCATETKNDDDIKCYRDKLDEVLHGVVSDSLNLGSQGENNQNAEAFSVA